MLDSTITELVMSSEFVGNQEFKSNKIEKSIYVRTVDGSLNKKGLINHKVKVNIYYQ